MCGMELLCKCAQITENASYTRRRGPEDSKTVSWADQYTCRFWRLRINGDDEKGMQPFVVANTLMMCNGEIYNHEQLRNLLEATIAPLGQIGTVDLLRGVANLSAPETKALVMGVVSDACNPSVVLSDCDIVLKMAVVQGLHTTLACLGNAEYAFLIVSRDTVYAARDVHGVRPLYHGICRTCGLQNYASTPDVLLHTIESRQLRCGGLHHHLIDEPTQVQWTAIEPVFAPELLYNPIQILEDIVYRYLTMTRNDGRTISILLSGGLDSSCLAFIATKVARQTPDLKLQAYTFYYDKSSPDLAHARALALELKLPLKEVAVEPNLVDVDETIRVTGTYCTTTIRASTLQLCGFRAIHKEQSGKVVFITGEGADETLGGYQYFERAPNATAFHAESRRLQKNIHKADGLRVDRTAGAYGFEVRLPYLAPHFVESIMMVPAEERFEHNALMTKHWFRERFQHFYSQSIGPHMARIVQRPKNALSDAVGMDWVPYLQHMIEAALPDDVYRRLAAVYYPDQTPTKEQVYYRQKFVMAYPNHHCLDEIWMPRWHDGVTDPSARHIASFKVEQ